ncbi:MAG: hypothetical protein IJ093_04525 [Bacilli bacterium]|nr:hypothetical protein [Bacilli bacterium]
MIDELEFGFDNFSDVKRKSEMDNETKTVTENVQKIFGDEDGFDFLEELNDTDFENDPLSNTQKILNFNDDEFQSALERIEGKKEKVLAKEDALTATDTYKTTFEESFVNCSILGFITLFMGFGWLFWLLNYIAI